MIEIAPYNELVTCVKTGSEMNGRVVMWHYSYLIDDVLIDAGCPNAADELNELRSRHPVRRIYVTHAHEDHAGGCSVFAQDAEIFAKPSVSNVMMNPEVLNAFFIMAWGQPKAVTQVNPIPDEFQIGKLRFEILPLPGHTDDMVGFYEKEKGWLFSGDAVPFMPEKQLAMPDENVPETIKTLEMIQKLNLRVLFDAHMGPTENPREHIQKRIDYLREIQNVVREHSAQGLTVTEIQGKLKIVAPWWADMTEGRFSVDNLIRSLIQDEPAVELADDHRYWKPCRKGW
jgi:glyoxylase-like metal-dependent hydrolase (beta-lactamase superfamily II)